MAAIASIGNKHTNFASGTWLRQIKALKTATTTGRINASTFCNIGIKPYDAVDLYAFQRAPLYREETLYLVFILRIVCTIRIHVPETMEACFSNSSVDCFRFFAKIFLGIASFLKLIIKFFLNDFSPFCDVS